jgi:LysM repeat protein
MPHPTLRRLLLPTVIAAFLAIVAACGTEAASGVETLPPIRTTTSTSTTTTTTDPRGVIYIVQPGDNVSEIARDYQVTAQMIIEANGLPADGEIQPGQELQIPRIRVDTTRPTVAETSSTSSAP